MKILEKSFESDSLNIKSQEELFKVLQKAIKNNIDIKFDMPFMSKEDYDKLRSQYGGDLWRYQNNFEYSKFYKDYGIGHLKRIDSKKYIIIIPENNKYVTDNRLTIHELYNELVISEDFMMFIDNKQVDFRNDNYSTKSLEKDVDTINSLESFVKVIKKCDKNKVRVEFDIPFAKKEYAEKLKNVDSYIRIRMMMDPKVRDEYEVSGTGVLKYLAANKYVIIDPDDKNLLVDQRLTFKELYDNLLNNPEDYSMKIDGKNIEFTNNIGEGISMSKRVLENKFNKMAEEASKKFKDTTENKVGEDTPEDKKEDKKETKTNQKFVIELSFNYDGDSDLADCIEEQLGKKAEVNEVLRTRRIMEFDFKNKSMFDAAMKTITDTMKSKGKTDYKLDSRMDDDVEAPSTTPPEELTDQYNLSVTESRYPVYVTMPLIVESLKWASKSRINDTQILEYALDLIKAYKNGDILDIN